jgi:type I restriction-modification system DNA methylase subunit
LAIVGSVSNHAGLIWAIADLLRGDYKQSEYGRVILPLVVLRRLDCVLEPTKQQVLGRLASLEGRVENVGPILQAIPAPLHGRTAIPAKAGQLEPPCRGHRGGANGRDSPCGL